MQLISRMKNLAIADLQNVIADTSRFLARHHILRPAAISPANLRIFESWSEERIQHTTLTSRRILDVHAIAETENIDLDDSTRLLHVALNILGYSVDPTFYKMIHRNDILEVYEADHVQVFRSFNFFRICNYNLDDILAYQWPELYERDLNITNALLMAVQEHLNGNINISQGTTPEHVIRERFSDVKATFISKNKLIATIYSGPDRRPAYACTGTVRQVTTLNDQLKFLNLKV